MLSVTPDPGACSFRAAAHKPHPNTPRPRAESASFAFSRPAFRRRPAVPPERRYDASDGRHAENDDDQDQPRLAEREPRERENPCDERGAEDGDHDGREEGTVREQRRAPQDPATLLSESIGLPRLGRHRPSGREFVERDATFLARP